MTAINKSQKTEIEGLATHKDDPILNISAVAEALGKNPATISRWIEDGLIETVLMPSGLRKVRKSVVTALIKGTYIGKTKSVQKNVSKLVGDDD